MARSCKILPDTEAAQPDSKDGGEGSVEQFAEQNADSASTCEIHIGSAGTVVQDIWHDRLL